MPQIVRRDLVLLKVGTAYKQTRKDVDRWEITDEPNDRELVLYYEDIRPHRVGS